MSSWDKRYTYPAVTLTITVWFLVAGGALTLKPQIPRDDTNPVFAKYSTHVHWKFNFAEARAESAKTGKPLLFVLTHPTSPAAVAFNDLVNQSGDLIHELNDGFEPVSVDLDQEPGMDGMFLPLFRVAKNAEAGLEFVSFDRKGRLAGVLILGRGSRMWRESELFSELGRLQNSSEAGSRTGYAIAQESDLALLKGTGVSEAVDVDAISGRTARGLPAPLTGTRMLNLLESGRDSDVASAVNLLLISGGFDWTNLSFNPPSDLKAVTKRSQESLAIHDADMVAVLDKLASSTGDKAYRNLSQLIFDRLLSRRDARGALIGSIARGGDERNRIAGASWSPEQISVLGKDQADFAAFWKIHRLSNPELRPRPLDWRSAVENWPKWEPMFNRLSSTSRSQEIYSLVGSREVSSYLLWRLLPIAASWGRVEKLGPLRPALETPRRSSAQTLSAGDAFTPALALLEIAESKSSTPDLQMGRAALDEALKEFVSDRGQFVSAKFVNQSDPLVALETPDVVDRGGASTVARAIEAIWRYGCVTPGPDGLRLRALAQQILGQVASAANSIGTSVDGLAMVARRIQSGSVRLRFGPSPTDGDSSAEKVVNSAGWNISKPGIYRLTNKGLVYDGP